ncbi:MAG: phenoxybenzoate dioxygenase [Noviherbaspirillum sp.]|jgi:3-phenylpropionate/cinnamic acid dioxygenase small subunit|nr:phenoxybenzoate dioxygenase [Noviherbaspirillum sp.]
MTTTLTSRKPAARAALNLDQLREFIENEADLLDEQRYDDWYAQYADDGVYWVPALHGQESWTNHVSLYYDEKHMMKTRVQRLKHPMLHCQEPGSRCVRVLSNFRLEWAADDGSEYRVRSKFIMLEDRAGADRRFFGGRYVHTLRRGLDDLKIVLKRVELTNCDQSFPLLTQPF